MVTRKNQERKTFLENVVVEYYLNNKDVTLREIEKIFNCSRYIIAKILKDRNLTIRNRYHDINLKYNFSSIDSSESAYWLGFIYADGSITYTPNKEKNRYVLEIGLKEEDYNHLLKFKTFIGSHCSIKYREKTKSYRLTVSSKELTMNLHKLGILKNKTYNDNICNIWENVPISYKRDFIRGYFDGDGHITKDNKIIFTGYFTKSIIFLLNNILQDCKYRVYEKKKSCSTDVRLLKKESTFLLHYMYSNSTIFLDRKYEKYKIAVLNGNI